MIDEYNTNEKKILPWNNQQNKKDLSYQTLINKRKNFKVNNKKIFKRLRNLSKGSKREASDSENVITPSICFCKVVKSRALSRWGMLEPTHEYHKCEKGSWNSEQSIGSILLFTWYLNFENNPTAFDSLRQSSSICSSKLSWSQR